MNQGIDFSQIPLRDIHLPGDVPWWPPAPGWWLLAAGILAGLVFWGLKYYWSRRQRLALKILRQVKLDLEQGLQTETCLQRLSSVLRRFAMSNAANPGLVAGLIGSAWLQYLDSCWRQDAFMHGSGRILTVAPYAPANSVSTAQAVELTALCIDWVKCQRPVH